MRKNREGFHLKMDEFLTILKLAGKQNYVGFRTGAEEQFTPEIMLNACCRLMQDKALTQVDGRYQLHKDLFDAMVPIKDASRVVSLIPQRLGSPQILYYVADRVTAMEQAVFGGFTLYEMGREDLVGDILEELPAGPVQAELPKPSGISLTAEIPELMENAKLVLECIQGQIGTRIGWIRIVSGDRGSYLDWTNSTTAGTCPLTAETLKQVLEGMLGSRKGV